MSTATSPKATAAATLAEYQTAHPPARGYLGCVQPEHRDHAPGGRRGLRGLRPGDLADTGHPGACQRFARNSAIGAKRPMCSER